MNRRGFLTGLIGLVAAPAIVRAASLMPVRPVPSMEQLFFADNLVFPPVVQYRREFIRGFEMTPGALSLEREVLQLRVTKPDGQQGVEMHFPDGEVFFLSDK